MASVDYLETVHPLDYPIFQALVSKQFAERRSTVSSAVTSLAVDTSPKPSTDIGPSEVVPPSPGEASVAAHVSLSDDQTNSGNVITTYSAMSSADDSCYALNTTDSLSDRNLQEAPSDGSSSHNSNSKSIDRSETTPSTSRQGELSPYMLQRTPACLHTALSSLRPRKQSRHEKKAVSFKGARRLFKPRGAVLGTLHHNSADKGLSSYRGSQCTSIAMTAIMASKSLPVHTWITSDIDAIIRSGDRLHGLLMSDIEAKPGDSHLSLHQVQSGGEYVYTIPAPNPNLNSWFHGNPVALQMSMSKSLQFQGKVRSHNACSKMNKTGDISMEDALSHIFDYGYDGALIAVGESTGAVMQDFRGSIRYFDSQSHNKQGHAVRNGTAALLKFQSIRHFVSYLRWKEKNPESVFEILGVTFKVLGRYVLSDGHED